MKIRKFKEEDSERVIELLKEFLDYTRKTYTKDALRFDDYISNKKNLYAKHILKYFKSLKNSCFLVAEEDSKIVGYIIGKIETNPYKVMKKAGRGVSLFVSEKFRNKGIGRKLSKKLNSWFKNKKCDHIELDVYMGNKKTILMYNKLGFKEVLIKMKKKL